MRSLYAERQRRVLSARSVSDALSLRFAFREAFLVGARGFEPPTSRTRTVRATKLRYAPIDFVPGFST